MILLTCSVVVHGLYKRLILSRGEGLRLSAGPRRSRGNRVAVYIQRVRLAGNQTVVTQHNHVRVFRTGGGTNRSARAVLDFNGTAFRDGYASGRSLLSVHGGRVILLSVHGRNAVLLSVCRGHTVLLTVHGGHVILLTVHGRNAVLLSVHKGYAVLLTAHGGHTAGTLKPCHLVLCADIRCKDAGPLILSGPLPHGTRVAHHAAAHAGRRTEQHISSGARLHIHSRDIQCQERSAVIFTGAVIVQGRVAAVGRAEYLCNAAVDMDIPAVVVPGISAGVQTIAARVNGPSTAVDIQRDFIRCRVRCRVHAVIGGRNTARTAVEEDTRAFEAFVTGADGDFRTVSVFVAERQVIVGVQRVIPGLNGVTPAADGNASISVQRVIRAVQRKGTPADNHLTAGFNAFCAVIGAKLSGVGRAAVSLDIERTARDGYVSGTLNAVTLRANGHAPAVDVNRTLRDRILTVGFGLDPIAVRRDVDGAALNDDRVVTGDPVIGRLHIQRYRALDRNRGFRRALDSVLARGAVRVQSARAGNRQGRARLHLDGRAFKRFGGLIGKTFFVAERHRADRVHRDVRLLVTGQRRGRAGSKGQILKNQRYARGPLLDRDTAFGTGSGNGVHAGSVDCQRGSFDFVAALRTGRRHAAVGERQGRVAVRDADRALTGGCPCDAVRIGRARH